ncbi:Hypothetical protein AA314_03318 [Archangium gephyra]|uniref:Uncharacterized protein n=1 Tax=Archangium gephyra TaxID=48 RepID=A0AAC8TDC8_9BACT|nr:Hypothetical protein AA314_03318 [Archangium gephyra]
MHLLGARAARRSSWPLLPFSQPHRTEPRCRSEGRLSHDVCLRGGEGKNTRAPQPGLGMRRAGDATSCLRKA